LGEIIDSCAAVIISVSGSGWKKPAEVGVQGDISAELSVSELTGEHVTELAVTSSFHPPKIFY
jgi:hypothetical protein